MLRTSLLMCACLAIGITGGAAYGADAQSRIDGMATQLATAEAFGVTIDMTYDVMQPSGQLLQFAERRQVKVRRPNDLRIDSHQSDGDIYQFLYDGRLLTLSHPNENVYSQVDHEGDVDSALRYAVGTLGIRTPLARLLVSSLPQDIGKLTQTLTYVEKNTLDATATHHIAGRTRDVDYQVWLDDDNRLQRIVISYRNAPGHPQFQADFSAWDMSVSLSDADFAFAPPSGAEKIPTLLPRRPAGSMKGVAE